METFKIKPVVIAAADLSLGMHGLPNTLQEIHLPSEITSETEEYILYFPGYNKLHKAQHIS